MLVLKPVDTEEGYYWFSFSVGITIEGKLCFFYRTGWDEVETPEGGSFLADEDADKLLGIFLVEETVTEEELEGVIYGCF